MIGYQFDEFTCIWSAELIVAHLNIYPGLTGKVASLNTLHLNQGVMIIHF